MGEATFAVNSGKLFANLGGDREVVITHKILACSGIELPVIIVDFQRILELVSRMLIRRFKSLEALLSLNFESSKNVHFSTVQSV